MKYLVALLMAAVLTTSACTGSGPEREKPVGAASAEVTKDGVRLGLGGLTVVVPAGSAPAGSRLTMKPAAGTVSDRSGEVLVPLTPLIDVSLDDAGQPTGEVVLSAKGPAPTADGSKVMLLTRHGSEAWELQDATWDPSVQTYSGTVTRFSLFGFVRVDVSPALRQLKEVFTSSFGLSAKRPDCAGKPLTVGEVTYSLPERYRKSGDGLVWPCLSADGDTLDVQLTNAGGLPLLVRSRPTAEVRGDGSVDIGDAALLAFYEEYLTGGSLSQSLLLPGHVSRYRFDAAELPGRIEAKVDGLAQTASAVLWAVEFMVSLFIPESRVAQALQKAQTLNCVADAVSVDRQFSARAVGELAKAVISCASVALKDIGGIVGGVIGVVLATLGGGVGLVAGNLVAAWRTVTGTDVARFDIEVTRAEPTLGFDHYGPVRLGTGVAAAAKQLGTNVEDEGASGNDQCWQPRLARPHDGLTLMTQSSGGPIQRFSAYGDTYGTAPSRSPVTDDGIRIGSSEAEVKRAYKVTVEDHAYEPGGHYLTATGPRVDGRRTVMVFETDSSGQVTTIRSGFDDWALAIEGCS